MKSVEPTVGIIDYGSGNITALIQALKCISVKTIVLKNRYQINNEDYSHLILPGVGRFDISMDVLRRNDLIEPIINISKTGRYPILGICLGMHLMADYSYEGNCEGLSLIPGVIKPLKDIGIKPTPHMGWNKILIKTSKYSEIKNEILDIISQSHYYYFIHSFFFDSENKNNNLGFSHYLKDFTVAVSKENILGVQFHPEKSHQAGLDLLEKFTQLSC